MVQKLILTPKLEGGKKSSIKAKKNPKK